MAINLTQNQKRVAARMFGASVLMNAEMLAFPDLNVKSCGEVVTEVHEIGNKLLGKYPLYATTHEIIWWVKNNVK